MLLKILQTGNPTLRQTAKPLTKKQLASKKTQDLIGMMVATLRDAPGVGLAAPQVGEPMRLIVIDDKAEYQEPVPPKLLKEQGRKPIPLTVIVNPKLKITSQDEALYFEGCLSVDGYLAAVPRATKVQVTGWDRHGKDISITASGWFARILQHEIDHLDGTLYIDKMQPTSFMNLKNFNLHWRKALQKEIRKTFG